MVDVEHLGEGPGLEPQSVSDQCPLEVTHTTLPTLDALLEGGDGARRQSIDAPTDIFRGLALVEEARNPQLLVGADVEGFLVVDIVGDAHQAVSLPLPYQSEELSHIGPELLFAEDGVDRGQYKRLIAQPATQLPHAVHAAGRRLDDELQGHPASLAYLLQMRTYLGHLLIADGYYLCGPVGHENAQQTVDQPFTAHLHQRLRTVNPFLSEP